MIYVVKLKPLPIKRRNRPCGHQIVGISDFEASVVYLERDEFGNETWHVKKNPTVKLIRDLVSCRAVFPAIELQRDEFLEALREFIRGPKVSVAMNPRKQDLIVKESDELKRARNLGYFR